MTLKINNFRLPHVKKRSRNSSLETPEPWFSFELVNRILITWLRIICIGFSDFFHEQILQQGGVYPQMPLIVKVDQSLDTCKSSDLEAYMLENRLERN